MISVAWRISLILLLVLVAAGVGALIDGRSGAMVAALLVLIGAVARDSIALSRLIRWLKAPEVTPVPNCSGAWAEVFYRASRQLRLWTGRLGYEESKLHRFIEALQVSPNGVILLDENNQIDWCNATAAQHFGLDAQRDLRQHAVHLIRTPEFVAYLQAAHFHEPLHMHRAGSRSQFTLSVQVFPYGDQQKLLLSQDITQLERTESMRRDFVANVSHEIKTPLTVLGGFVETMRDMPLDETQRLRVLDMMQTQSDRMRHLVDDLLALARLEGDPYPPTEMVIDMPSMMTQYQNEALALSGGRHQINMEARTDLWVRGSPQELHSALSNLVSNAVRYTPDGGAISLAWDAVLIDGQPRYAEFSVSDTGIGIAAEHIPRLTERFYRVDRGRSRESGGTGLGLAIAKHVLVRHQAELLVHSTPGKGSRFVVRFPAARLAPAGTPSAGRAAEVSPKDGALKAA
ncbi:MAG: PAS domain-containing sensor histidine kinase [Thiomonas sp. 14-64-326]|jgi:two-component system phosphate regulon sensor histidine kinase PhoR|uniref:Phosphate regulon sensor protein PhoR n=1 Tax=Thiomonas intermedia (strain K12) TaxID=75379 RepID=D5X1U0_THIK1|nr:phosphate regulon sensor histidine kinase PhoR [Thiomonas sp.]OZB76245.1 MAG: PAS domain-containing sensor histidine kinase [Thiomonas sp. 14-64-326]